jgi:hypothetical protein
MQNDTTTDMIFNIRKVSEPVSRLVTVRIAVSGHTNSGTLQQLLLTPLSPPPVPPLRSWSSSPSAPP